MPPTYPQLLQVTTPVVLGYTVLHLLAFAVFGILCAMVIAASEREPTLLWAFIALFACFEVFFIVLQGIAGSVLGALVGWSILVGNLLASAGMLGYFFLGHRALGRRRRVSSVAPPGPPRAARGWWPRKRACILMMTKGRWRSSSAL